MMKREDHEYPDYEYLVLVGFGKQVDIPSRIEALGGEVLEERIQLSIPLDVEYRHWWMRLHWPPSPDSPLSLDALDQAVLGQGGRYFRTLERLGRRAGIEQEVPTMLRNHPEPEAANRLPVTETNATVVVRAHIAALSVS
jgi:hypothetical protein